MPAFREHLGSHASMSKPIVSVEEGEEEERIFVSKILQYTGSVLSQ